MINPEAYIRFKDMPNFQSMFGNIGNSWDNPYPKDLYIKGVIKNLTKDFTEVKSAAGAPGAVTDLHTYTINAGSLKAGEILYGYYGGFFNNNDNNKNLVVDFGTANVETTGLIDIDDLGWQFLITYGIVDATTVAYALSLVAGLVQADSTPALAGGFGGRCISRGGVLTPANLDSNNQVLRVRGQGTALGDVTKRVAEINIVRF